jgi:phage shock protein A
MGIFSRLSDIISANVNALLDKAEDPEKMIVQVVREMEEGLANAKRFAVTAIAAERRLGRELEQNRTQSEFWKSKAREALVLHREDLARRILARKHEHEDLVRNLEIQYADAMETSANVRTVLRALEARLAEARRRQRTFLARHRAAKVYGELHQLGSCRPNFDSAQAKFEQLENRLADFEDEMTVQAEFNYVLGGLEVETANLEREQAIHHELEALKREIEGKETTSS